MEYLEGLFSLVSKVGPPIVGGYVNYKAQCKLDAQISTIHQQTDAVQSTSAYALANCEAVNKALITSSNSVISSLYELTTENSHNAANFKKLEFFTGIALMLSLVIMLVSLYLHRTHKNLLSFLG